MTRGIRGRFDLRGPCADCPFRTDKPFYLGERRAAEIADSMVDDDAPFTCHKTIDYSSGEPNVTDNGRACAGAMVILEKMGHPNQEMRIAERLGWYDPARLDMDAPVPDSMDEWVAYQASLIGGRE